MKISYKYIILLLVVSFLGIVSCSDNAVNDQKQKPDLAKIKAKYSKIGKLHNEGLNYIYEAIKNNSAKINSKKELISVLNTSGRLFLKNKFHSKSKNNQAKRSFSNKLAQMFNNGDLKNVVSNANNTKSKTNNPFEMLNKDQKQQLHKLFDLLGNSTNLKGNSNLNSFNKSINKFEKQAAAKLDSKKELVPIIIGAIVAKSSMKYWLNNKDKWAELINNINNENKSKSTIINQITASPTPLPTGFFSNLWKAFKNTVKADAAGAVSGFIAANVTGCGEATEEICGGAAAVGVGLGASAGYNILNL